MSPSRSCLTDTEILRSPSEVLYAVSDKHRHNANEHMTSSGMQTDPASSVGRDKIVTSTFTKYQRPRSAYNYTSSREDLMNQPLAASGDEIGSYKSLSRRSTSENHRYVPNGGSNSASRSRGHVRSLDRLQHSNVLHNDELYDNDMEANKENTFKTRIQVISPERQHQHMISNGTRRQDGHRKPYKTTINTATDNILYRGTSTDNLSFYHYGDEHYKVPRGNRPVNPRPGSGHVANYHRMNNSHHDSDHSSYRGRGDSSYVGSTSSRPFASTKLVKNVESNRSRVLYERDRDREGRSIRRDAAHGMMHGGSRIRNYSGHSTSPDREVSPDRSYRQQQQQPRAPPRSYSNYMNRSPSTSPTRPPRSRSSPTREMLHQQQAGVRRVSSRRAAGDGSLSRVHNDLGGHHRERSHESARRSQSSNAAMKSSNSSYMMNGVPGGREDDRLARFTEYRGEDIIMPHAQDPHAIPRRVSSAERERGQSLPPGATIDNIRDFYKSSQYKSMYALPPSPSRPAPVLDRGGGGGSMTIQRPRVSPKVNISEGEITDEGMVGQHQHRNVVIAPPEKVPRRMRPASSGPRPPSAKRQAPSPPMAPSTGKGLVVRRVVSSDGRGGAGGRVISSNNVQQPPTSRRIVVGRRSSVDALDSSFSESEGFNGEPDPVSDIFVLPVFYKLLTHFLAN